MGIKSVWNIGIETARRTKHFLLKCLNRKRLWKQRCCLSGFCHVVISDSSDLSQSVLQGPRYFKLLRHSGHIILVVHGARLGMAVSFFSSAK